MGCLIVACRKHFFDTLQAVKKVSEFRFLANFAVQWYRLFAKNEKRQKCHKFNVCGTFSIPPSTINRTHLHLHNRSIKRLVYFIGVVQGLYRQSKIRQRIALFYCKIN